MESHRLMNSSLFLVFFTHYLYVPNITKLHVLETWCILSSHYWSKTAVKENKHDLCLALLSSNSTLLQAHVDEGSVAQRLLNALYLLMIFEALLATYWIIFVIFRIFIYLPHITGETNILLSTVHMKLLHHYCWTSLLLRLFKAMYLTEAHQVVNHAHTWHVLILYSLWEVIACLDACFFSLYSLNLVAFTYWVRF